MDGGLFGWLAASVVIPFITIYMYLLIMRSIVSYILIWKLGKNYCYSYCIVPKSQERHFASCEFWYKIPPPVLASWEDSWEAYFMTIVWVSYIPNTNKPRWWNIELYPINQLHILSIMWFECLGSCGFNNPHYKQRENEICIGTLSMYDFPY